MVWIVRVVGVRREMDAERAADTEKGAHDMTYTPEQISAHIAQRAAAVGENSADVRILRQLVADVGRMREALADCRDELDNYSQHEYPSDHPVHIAHRKRDHDANPARIALSALSTQETPQ